jgi:hypothetical protein
MRLAEVVCVVAGVALAAIAAGAEEELAAVPNRPTASTTAETVERGVLEIEAGGEIASGHRNVNGLLKVGALSGLELWLAGNPYEGNRVILPPPPMPGLLPTESWESGLGDTSVGFKLRVLSQEGRVPSAGLLYLAKLPTSDDELAEVDHSLVLLLSKDYGKHHLDLNQGLTLMGRPIVSGFAVSSFTALTWSYPLTDRVGIAAELSGESATDYDDATLATLAAVTYAVKPRLVLDAAVSVGLLGNLPDATVMAGLTYSVGRIFR